jgi:hypothetical protein
LDGGQRLVALTRVMSLMRQRSALLNCQDRLGFLIDPAFLGDVAAVDVELGYG